VDPQRYRVERLGPHHDRAAFSCGEESLDTYLRQQARRDDERNVAKAFILYDSQEGRVAGYYTLSSASVQLDALPPDAQRKLPRYTHAPVILLGRLAIDGHYQDQHLGEVLLFNALRRAFNVGTQEIAAMAVIVDALHDRARAFYERYGFQRFPDNELRLFLPMQTIGQVLESEDDEG
jgi:ribosomal protein S18 acetylase RimI-like enzyme